tara:strand:- start:37 stop:621 length:585 start_codon:yes stop_codon:yes gene_type:complete
MAVNQNNQSILNKSRLDKFLLVFSIPPALREVNVRENTARNSTNVIEDKLQLSVYGAVVPELTVPSIQIPYAGSNLYQSAHAREPYPPVTVNFTADNEFNNYWVIYKWLNLMHDQKTGVYDETDLDPNNEFNNYQTDMTLYGLDEYENKRIEFTYTKAFPVTLGNLEYNYRTSDEIESSFTFVYSQLHTKLLDL